MENFVAVVMPDNETHVIKILSSMKTIQDLQDVISQDFNIDDKILLVLNNCVLPENEDIRILNYRETIKVVTGNYDAYQFMGARIKLDLNMFHRGIRRFVYVRISSEMKTLAVFKEHILKMCSIPKPIVLLLNRTICYSLDLLKDGDVIVVMPDYLHILN